MSRTTGTYTLTSNIEPKVGAPLDARTIVKLKSDLTTPGTFAYPYVGLTVFVEEDQKKYTLIDIHYTYIANWREEGSGTTTSADHVTYDNTASQLESTNVQDVVDEIVNNLGTAASKDATDQVIEDSEDLVTSGAVYDALENLPSGDTWRNIKVNGTEKLGTATTTGAVDFVNGTNTTVSFDTTGNKIKIDAVDTTYEEATTSVAGLMSASDKTKLNNIAPGAEVNVQSDWDQTTTTADDYIKNKPTIPPAVAVKGNAETAYRTGNVNITKGNIGLGNVDNTSDATKKTNFTGSIASGNTGFITGGDAYTALNSKLNTSLKGAANGLAELDADGKVPSSQLPSYVDDVIEVADYAHLPITGESGKIYVTLDTNLTYRWSGSEYVEVSKSLALGETSSTAYRGDRGKTAYNHATESGKISAAVSSGFYKIAATAQGHVAGLTAVQKSDITALGIPGSDTNTHRPIQVNGTQNLGNNTTALNLKNGTNITVTADGGNVTIATSAEVNQNAFSNVKVGSTAVAADSKTDTLELVAGSNVTITPDATNDKITIAATDTNTTYTFAGGTNKFTVTPSGGTAQDVNITVNDSTKLPLTGGTLTGRVTTTKALNDIITGTGTAAQDRGSGDNRYVPAKWTFNTGLTATNGDIVVVKVPVDGHDYGTYMSIDNGATYYAVNSINTTRLTTQYPTGNYVALIFDSNATTSMYPLNGGTSRGNVTGAWRVFNNYDSGNNDTYNRNRYQATIKADSNGIAVNNIAVGNSSGIFSQLNKGLPFDIDQPILFVERAIAANGTDTRNYDITALAITTTQNITLTAYLPVYIKGTLSGKTFTPVSTTPLTQTVPTSADNYYYMLLGRAYNATQIYLQEVHPIFAYTSGSFRECVGAASFAINASKVNNHTVETDVPSGAVFTDTKVTSSGNHYTPSTASGQDKSASASGATAAWSIDVVKGVTLNTDGKGHVTGISVTSGKIPANPLPSNNITGSGTSGYIAKFNGTNTITNGPAFGSATTTYLRNDGTWATPTDTNTHRPIQVNGTEILGNNTTALNLKAGSNVSVTNSSGTVTIAATDTNTTYTVTTGDSNGKIKVTPSSGDAYNVAVKGLGSNAYTSTAYLPLAGGTMTGGITFNKVNNAIVYTGTKATYNMVKFIDNIGDEYGNGISIGGGGLTIIGGGESADAVASGKSGGEEMLYLANDQSVQIITGVQNGLSSAKTFEFKTDGTATFDGKWVGRFTANPTSGQVVITDGTTGGMKSSGYTIATSVPFGAVFTDTKVTSTANHYTPATVSGQDKSASATGATAAWSIDVVKGVTLNTDGKGHVTGLSVTSGKIPANPVASNTITGSGTSGYLTKWNGTNTITNGPQLGSATTTYLRNDGSWATPDNTKNTAGSTDTSSKIFLIGATSQAANPQTYSHDTAYVGTDGCLYSGGTKVLTAHQDISGKVNKSGDTMSGDLSIKHTTAADMTYTATNPYISLQNGDNSQAVKFMFTDKDSYRAPYGVKLIGNGQSSSNYGAWFETEGKFYSKGLNILQTGTGTTAQDKGSGVSPRYFPAKWTFNLGANPADGDELTIKIPCAGHDYGVFISTDNGTTYKPVGIKTQDNGRLTTHFGNGKIITLMYDSTAKVDSVYAAAGADARSNITGAWKVMTNYLDGNDNTYDRNRYNCNIKAWGTKIIGGNIIVGINGLYHHLKEGTAFDITYPILYLNGDCNASATTTNTYDIIHFTSTTTQNTSWTAYTPVYIKGSLSGNTFTPISTTPLLQTVPTSEDNYYYMLLGIATTTNTIYLQERHPIFAYRYNQFAEITWNSQFASFLKPVASNTTPSFSSWSIPSGCYQVWGQRWADNRLKYTPSGGSETTVTDTGDWTMWLAGNGTSNSATFNMRIDGNYYGNAFVGNLSGNASSATKATQDESGNNIKATYAASFSISDHTITLKNKNGASLGTVTVPDNNTLNTAGATDTSSKIFLIGATSQAANPQTYSDNEVYATSGVLTTKSVQVGGTAATMQYNSTNHCIDFIVT